MPSHHAFVFTGQPFQPGPYPLDLNSRQTIAFEQPAEGSPMTLAAHPSG
jgi:hypothetical protein